jgi:hypothetical protein
MTRQSDVVGRWRKSTRSEPGGCVEVRIDAHDVRVRDSKNQTGPVLRFNHAEWRAFLDGVADGEFDLPADPVD